MYPYESKYDVDGFALAQGRPELLLRVPGQAKDIVTLAELDFPPPVLVLTHLGRLHSQIQGLKDQKFVVKFVHGILNLITHVTWILLVVVDVLE